MLIGDYIILFSKFAPMNKLKKKRLIGSETIIILQGEQLMFLTFIRYYL